MNKNSSDLTYVVETYNLVKDYSKHFGGEKNYANFYKKYSVLIIKHISTSEWDKFLIKFYKQVSLDAITFLNNKIKENKNKGQRFHDIKKSLDEINYKLLSDNLDLKSMRELSFQLMEKEEDILERIDLDKANNRKFLWGLFFGFLLGIMGVILLHFLFGI